MRNVQARIIHSKSCKVSINLKFVAVLSSVLKKMKPSSRVTPEMRALVTPDFAEYLASPAFEKKCMARFDKLDTNKDETLSREEPMPVIVDILDGVEFTDEAPTQHQCMTFVSMVFDQDGDGNIDRTEWLYLIEYCAVMHQQTVAAKRARANAQLANEFADEGESKAASQVCVCVCMCVCVRLKLTPTRPTPFYGLCRSSILCGTSTSTHTVLTTVPCWCIVQC